VRASGGASALLPFADDDDENNFLGAMLVDVGTH
jgi:hypothetical protein